MTIKREGTTFVLSSHDVRSLILNYLSEEDKFFPKDAPVTGVTVKGSPQTERWYFPEITVTVGPSVEVIG